MGGIFFDDLDATDPRGFDPQQFTKEVARGVVASWAPIVERRQREGYTDDQRQWQLLRRGRYLEFNLLYDRGVKVTPTLTWRGVAGVLWYARGAACAHLHTSATKLSTII